MFREYFVKLKFDEILFILNQNVIRLNIYWVITNNTI